MSDIYDIYAETVEYAKHLEKLLKVARIVDEDTLSEIRRDYITPSTNVSVEWLKK